VLVLLIGVWAAAQAMRKRDSVFTLEQRKLLWFWIISAVAALLLAFGRFAPFYWFLAQLPYFSNVRNPAKFLHIVCFALIVLFAHGVHALSRRKLLSETVVPGTKGTVTPPVIRPSAFDKTWIRGCIVAFAVALVGWLVYAHYRPAVEAYLQTVDFDEASARLIAGFSIRQVGIFVVVFALGVGLFTMILGGRFTGPKAKIGAVLNSFGSNPTSTGFPSHRTTLGRSAVSTAASGCSANSNISISNARTSSRCLAPLKISSHTRAHSFRTVPRRAFSALLENGN
jgi:hypothetical protein